ncbi:MAG: replicative DNA helicase [Armatimonadetes bacterium]|nr:replicative DNA helicase [Armatimonadota bacterium]
MADRVPPQNLEAEMGALGSMLLDRDAIARIVELLQPSDLYRDAHRLIFETIVGLFERGQPVDLITVTDRLRDAGRLEDVGGAGYIAALLNSVPTAANAEYYAKIVLQKSMLRQLIHAGTKIAHLGYEGEEDVEVLVDRAEKLVFGIAQRRTTVDFQPVRDILKETMERLDAGFDRGTITGVPTGFKELDEMTGGLQYGDLAIVAARPSMGKCLKHDALITDTRTGDVRTIEEIVRAKDVRLLSLDDRARLRERTPSAYVDDGVKPVFRVRTAVGRQVETTVTHPFLTPDGWKPLAHLRVGHYIAVPARVPVFGTLDLLSYKVRLVAYLAMGRLPADPEVSRDFLDAATAAAAVRAAVRAPVAAGTAAESNGPLPVLLPIPPSGDAELAQQTVADIAREFSELEAPESARRLPRIVFQLNRSKVCVLLNRLLACGARWEGEEAATPIVVDFPSATLARQVQHLLLRLGVVAAWDGEARLELRREASIKLLQTSGIFGWDKLRQWARFASTMLLEESDILWDTIVSIEHIGGHQVYDLTVPDVHNFVANDVCVHNTTFCLNIAQYAAVHHQLPIAVFSLETSKEQLVQRMLCAEAGVDGQRMRRGFLSEMDWRRIARAMGVLSEAPVYIDDSANLSVIELRAKARKLKAEHGLSLIIIDYVQLIQSYKRNENRTQELSEIARGIKSLAKELHVPIIAISQLSRAVEARESKIPMLSHLRESGELEQIADLVMMLYREDYYDQDRARKEGKENTAMLRIAKHRNGPTDDIELFFHKEHSRFASLDKKHAAGA